MMNRPYIICHMVTSVDGKVTGDFLGRPECEAATEIYYEINRNFKADGFICGRITMEGSFTGGRYPELTDYEPVKSKTDYVAEELSGFYAVAFDPKGRLGWETDKIIDPDEDPGYDGAQIIEVLTQQVDERYLGYLEKTGISYIFAGETEIDVELALQKLGSLFDCKTLLLEGGSIINGTFQQADAIDELSLVVATIIADKKDKPLFNESKASGYGLIKCENRNGVIVMNYKRK